MTADALLHWLLRTSIEASVLILAVLGLRLILGTRLSPAWRIGLWVLVGTKLMLPAFIPAGFGLGAWMKQEQAPIVEPSAAISIVAAPFESTSLTVSPAIPHSAFRTPHFILLAWLLGAFTVLGTALTRQARFNAFLRRRPHASAPLLRALAASLSRKAGISKPVSIFLMPAGTTPALVGIHQPRILLPEDWQTRFDDRSLRHVLLHELHHIKHHDLLWNWAATAVQALHWFNPLVWFVVSRFQADRELRCDAGALAILSPAERLDYGHTLLRIQETFFAPPAIAGLAPCVRNHPTLRQRILMIATPTTRQPWLHALLILTLTVLVSYSFTTARAAEKEVPPKVREGTTSTKKDPSEPSDQSERKKPAMKDGEREGGRKPNAERDGEKPRSGMKDGDKPRTGERDGEKPRTGPRDGEGMKKPGGERDGEGRKPSAESGQKPRKGEGDRPATASGEVITMHVTADGDTVVINGEKRSTSGLRGFLSTYLPEHPGAKVIVSGDPDTPLKSLHEIVDAVRDNGNKNVGIKAE